MRASSDSISWRGASIDETSVVSVLGTTTTTNTKNNSNKHQCLFAACVPAKECDSEEVKCAFVLFLLSLSLCVGWRVFLRRVFRKWVSSFVVF